MIAELRTDPDTYVLPLWFVLVRRRFRVWSTADLKRYQDHRLRQIVKYAVRRAPLYRDLYAGHDLNDVWRLPIINKKLLIDALSQANTLGLSREEVFQFCADVERSRDFTRRYRGLTIGMSSGTSGNKGVEITSPHEERYLRTAFLARFPFIPGEKMNLAFILRVSTPAFSLNRFGHRLTYVDQLRPLDEMIFQINNLHPNVISGPASMLKLLAQQAAQGKLTARPKRLISYAEVLYPEDREYLQRVFRAEVHEIYKATEGAIAMSCRVGSLHINEDLVAVETLDASGRPTAAGEPCHRLVVTDLHKMSVPIIRYALNDIITISPHRCACGSAFRVITQIQGRSDDMLWARRIRDNRWQPIFPDYIRRSVITASDAITDYQVIQDQPEKFTVRLAPRGDDRIADAVRLNIQRTFMRFGCAAPSVQVRWESPVPNKNSGKLIRIHRGFADPTIHN